MSTPSPSAMTPASVSTLSAAQPWRAPSLRQPPGLSIAALDGGSRSRDRFFSTRWVDWRRQLDSVLLILGDVGTAVGSVSFHDVDHLGDLRTPNAEEQQVAVSRKG